MTGRKDGTKSKVVEVLKEHLDWKTKQVMDALGADDYKKINNTIYRLKREYREKQREEIKMAAVDTVDKVDKVDKVDGSELEQLRAENRQLRDMINAKELREKSYIVDLKSVDERLMRIAAERDELKAKLDRMTITPVPECTPVDERVALLEKRIDEFKAERDKQVSTLMGKVTRLEGIERKYNALMISYGEKYVSEVLGILK